MLKGLERMKLRCNGLRFTVKEEAKIVVAGRLARTTTSTQ